ncbi:Hypothetical protein D9617_23g004880 [Elsinoe fawcettii]|nr:Hypothetical protein D9617_23g004880 [Elsinoe fawcettii]
MNSPTFSITSDMFQIDGLDDSAATMVPDLGNSILNKPARKSPDQDPEDHQDPLQILEQAEQELYAQGEIDIRPKIKQEPTDDDDDVICLGDCLIDLTKFPDDKVIVIDDDDDDVRITGAVADQLPEPKKRKLEDMEEEGNDQADHAEQPIKKKSTKAGKAKSSSKSKGDGRKDPLH